MRDPRIDELASLLVDRSLGVEAGWQVLVRSTPLARPLVDAVQERIARLGAYPILYLAWEMIGGPFAREAPLEVLAKPAPLLLKTWEECDAFLSISASENVREGADLSPVRRQLLQRRMEPLRTRQMAMEVPWVVCEFPTNAAAQEAGLALHEYEEFVYGAVLRDWDAEGRRMAGIAALFDAAEEVRIVGEGTDLTLSLAGRSGAIDDGHINMPGGEVFYSPIEDSADGEITFCEFPAVYYGHQVSGIRLVFEEGRVVDASAASGEDFLFRTLDSDDGARRLGELGIGCNPGIRRFSKNVAFDEKIDGTVHLAVGNSYSSTGGTNSSSVHWDIVKDLRNGGRLYVDGRLAQESGRWLALEPAAT
jgi:aminopeptidase